MNAQMTPNDFTARVLYDEPMSKHTSWHVGGPADMFFKPADVADLSAFLRSIAPATPVDEAIESASSSPRVRGASSSEGLIPILFIGLGSNLLVRDGGIRGAVVETHGALGNLTRVSQTVVEAGAGVPCAKLAKQCIKWGLGPAEFLAGIPGTLGGALAMNAGAFGGETWPHVVSVTTMDRNGIVRERQASEYRYGYRHVDGPHDWFIGARLQFERRPGVSGDDIRALLARRKATQPIGEWSCGSVFTNPPGDHAARLIESAGLKGQRIGGARVSQMHANFIVNDGSATARDIESLIERVQQTVQRTHGVALTTEVRMVGEEKGCGQ